MLIEATRRASRTAVQRIRDAFIEFDRIVFTDVDIDAEDAYEVVKDGGTYVLAVHDPTLDHEPLLADCGS